VLVVGEEICVIELKSCYDYQIFDKQEGGERGIGLIYMTINSSGILIISLQLFLFTVILLFHQREKRKKRKERKRGNLFYCFTLLLVN